jgi:hypothetical protein
MMSSQPPNYRYQTSSCWFTTRRSQARMHLLNSQTTALAIIPPNLQRAHLHRSAHPPDSAKTSLHPSRPNLVSTTHVLKSP